jgi:hypothetical protein
MNGSTLHGLAMALAVPRSPSFDPRLGTWVLWWTEWHWGMFFLRLPPVSIIPPILHTHISFIYHRRCIILATNSSFSRSQWPCGLRRGSAAARLLGLWVRIPPGAWMSVCCECCVLSGRGLCVGLVPGIEESYRVWCV